MDKTALLISLLIILLVVVFVVVRLKFAVVEWI